MKPCVAIAIYEHGDTIARVVESIAPLGLPCFIVDDGSSKPTRDEIDRLALHHTWIEVIRHPRNLGRGSALRTAYRKSAERGMTHVIQIDADGQHDVGDF
ncbi:MAG: glycosyltransferase, partial [bacterium]|nr:glycosyltransferase [bacterium]